MSNKVIHRLRTDREYNLPGYHELGVIGPWDMPVLKPCDVVPDDLVPFNVATGKNVETSQAIHFFIDDYQFQRVWTTPERYTELFKRFQAVLTPDFSLYMDMPQAMKLWNVYRSRYLGAWWQSQGVNVIPTLQWADHKSLEYCFDGLPTHSIVAVSTLGVIGDPEAEDTWTMGMSRALNVLRPSLVLHYGKPVPEFDWQGIDMIRYSNHVLERMKAHGR